MLSPDFARRRPPLVNYQSQGRRPGPLQGVMADSDPVTAHEVEHDRSVQSGRAWYLICLLPIAVGVIAAVLAIRNLIADIEDMPRVVVPGEQTFPLAADDYIIFGETSSIVDGVAYVNPTFRVRCAVRAADGSQVTLERPTATTSYGIAGYKGESMFKLSIPRTGSYRFSCEGDGPPAVLAIGHPLGFMFVFVILGAIGSFFLSGGIFLLIFIRRRRARGLPP